MAQAHHPNDEAQGRRGARAARIRWKTHRLQSNAFCSSLAAGATYTTLPQLLPVRSLNFAPGRTVCVVEVFDPRLVWSVVESSTQYSTGFGQEFVR